MLLATHYSLLQTTIQAALHAVAAADVTLPTVVLEQPKDASHGDVATNAALAFSKLLKTNPRALAQQLKEALAADERLQGIVATIDIAGPGFLNFRLQPAAYQAVIRAIRTDKHYGTGTVHAGQQVMVEFVSANPTGPLHVGHTRQAALGDALCNLIAAQGGAVTREFYYNDAGNQIHNLAVSVQARAQGIATDDARFPADGYRGDYIVDIAQQFVAKATVQAKDGAAVQANGDVQDVDNIRQFAVAYLRREQDLDLQAFGLAFDVYFLESSLYTEGRVEQAVARLKAAGVTYEDGGALWLRSTDFGDDKDRVMKKSDGSGYTYFVPDVAYHIRKWERGFAKVINVQGTDHFGTIARVRAGLQAANVGIPSGYPDYVLHSMVKVMRGAEEIKISKRTGGYVTMRELVEMAGRDAVRYFLVSRKADSEFVFDIELAQSKSDENPVYYIQYAHSRICSVFRNEALADFDLASLHDADLSLITHEKEIALLKRLASYPTLLADAAQHLAPHLLAFWLKDCAADFHSCYNATRVLVEDTALRNARLALFDATRQVLAHGLGLLGMSAPEKM